MIQRLAWVPLIALAILFASAQFSAGVRADDDSVTTTTKQRLEVGEDDDADASLSTSHSVTKSEDDDDEDEVTVTKETKKSITGEDVDAEDLEEED